MFDTSDYFLRAVITFASASPFLQGYISEFRRNPPFTVAYVKLSGKKLTQILKALRKKIHFE